MKANCLNGTMISETTGTISTEMGGTMISEKTGTTSSEMCGTMTIKRPLVNNERELIIGGRGFRARAGGHLRDFTDGLQVGG